MFSLGWKDLLVVKKLYSTIVKGSMIVGGLDVLRYALIHCDILSHEETAVLVDCGCSLLIGMICSMKKIDILQVDEETPV